MADDKKPPVIKAKESENFRGIIRIMGKDLNGQLPLKNALPRLKGVGRNISVSLIKIINVVLKIAPSTRVGDLTDEQILSIEKVIRQPAAAGIKAYLINHAKAGVGSDVHFSQSDLDFSARQENEQEKTLRSYKGWRKSLGQRVRGQHSRTTGRSGMAVGVLKKALKAAKAGGAAPAGGEKKEEKK